MWWIASEICYYLGLTLAVLVIPAVAVILWIMSLADRADPNYWFLLLVWACSALMFLAGVSIKRWVVDAE